MLNMKNKTKEQKMLRSFNFSTSTQVAFSCLNYKQESFEGDYDQKKNLYALMRQIDSR